jgi:hypothetical protein
VDASAPRGSEGFARAIGEVLRDGGDAVGLVDTKAGDREVAAIEADEGDVGAVESGDEGQAQALGAQHFLGEVRGDGVRDRVMNVEQVEVVELGNFGHARGKGEVVGRVLEEWVVGDGDFVETDVGFAAGEAEGRLVGDEVDVVAARGELDAELGGNDAGTAVGGIAGDADFHKAEPCAVGPA